MDELYIWICRWDEFQHYKRDRHKAPAWIKDYTRQLDDDRYRQLTLHQRGVLASLRQAFSKARADLKLDRSEISSRVGATVYQRDLKALNDAGFIEFVSRVTLEQRLDLFYSCSRAEVEVEVEKALNQTQPTSEASYAAERDESYEQRVWEQALANGAGWSQHHHDLSELNPFEQLPEPKRWKT